MREYIIGVDLGRDTDPTALIVGKIVLAPVKSVKVDARSNITYADSAISRSLAVVHAEQVPLRTPYPDIARRIMEITKSPQLAGRNDLVLDATGVGQPVVDVIRDGGVVAHGVKITAGEKESISGSSLTVPKVKLVDSVIALLHTQRLTFAGGLTLAPTIQQQLAEFQMKRQANGSAKYENRLDVIHDDLVIALGLACWWFVKLYGTELTFTPGKGKIDRRRISDPFDRGEKWEKRRAPLGW